MTSPMISVSRSHDGHVLLSDALSALGLKWRLAPDAARELANQLHVELTAGRSACQGTVATVGGTRVTFAWPRIDVALAIADLTRHAMAAERGT